LLILLETIIMTGEPTHTTSRQCAPQSYQLWMDFCKKKVLNCTLPEIRSNTTQGRIQRGAQGAHVPSLQTLVINDRDTLIEKVSNSNKAVAVCFICEIIIIMYFNFIVILLLPSPTLLLLVFFFGLQPFQKSAPPLSKLWICPCYHTNSVDPQHYPYYVFKAGSNRRIFWVVWQAPMGVFGLGFTGIGCMDSYSGQMFSVWLLLYISHLRSQYSR